MNMKATHVPWSTDTSLSSLIINWVCLFDAVLNDIAVFGDTNLESPSFLSNRAAVEVHMDVGCNFLGQKTEIDIELDIPLHARYQVSEIDHLEC